MTCCLIFSCKFNEEFYLKSDGRLDYKMGFSCKLPISALANFGVSKADSTNKIEHADTNKMNVDTTIIFKDIISKIHSSQEFNTKKLSLIERNELRYVDALSHFSFHLKINGEEFMYEFIGNSIVDSMLRNATKAMQFESLNDILKGVKEYAGKANYDRLITEKNVRWNGKTFIYKGEVSSKKTIPKNSSNLNDKSKMELENIMKQQGVVVRKFTFDKPIKTINMKTAQISEDKKSVTITYNLAKFEVNQKSDDIKIEVE